MNTKAPVSACAATRQVSDDAKYDTVMETPTQESSADTIISSLVLEVRLAGCRAACLTKQNISRAGGC